MTRLAVLPRNATGPTLESILRGIQGAGLDGVFLDDEHYRPFLGDPAGFIGRWGDWSPVIAGLIVEIPLSSEGGRAHFDKVVDLAAGIDGDRLLLAIDEKSAERAGLPETAAALERLADAARAAGLRLVLLNRAGSLIAGTEHLRLCLKALSPETVGLAIDTAHLALCENASPERLLEEFADRLDCLILSDLRHSRFPMLEDHRIDFVPPGQGDLDFAVLFRTLTERDLPPWLVFDPGPGALETGRLLVSAGEFFRQWSLRR